MASDYSPLLRIQLIKTGELSGTWGDATNLNLGNVLEEAIAATATINVAAGNVTLTTVNGNTDQSRCAAIRVTGSPGVSRNIIAPALSHIYVIANGSNAAVVLKTSVSTGLTIPAGQVYLAYYDPTSADFRMVGQAIASAGTANTLVLRDASGNFSAGTITVSGISNTGNTTLGDASADTLTVNATPTFNVAVPTTSGGTGQSSYAVGDVLYAATTTELAKLPDVATGNALLSGGVGVAPSYGKVGLTTHVSGTLPVANGGTGATAATGSGDVVLATSPTLTTPTLTTPTLSGVPIAPTAGSGTNTTQIATTEFVQTATATRLPLTGGTVSGSFAVTNTNNTQGFVVTDTSANGVNIRLVGNGVTTPSKYIRAVDGVFQIVNSAYTGVPFQVTDAGALTITGAFNGAGTGLTGTANSLNAGIGVNQTWQGVTRTLGQAYVNDTGRPIMLLGVANRSGASTAGLVISFNGGGNIPFCIGTNSSGGNNSAGSIIVPTGSQYVISNWSEPLTSYAIYELR